MSNNSLIKAQQFPALWANSINAGELEKVIGLYNKYFTLMPTFSPHSVNNLASLTDYFTQLGSRKGINVALHENTVSCQHTGANAYVLTGIYSFGFEVDGTLLTFPSRFTFVLNLDEEQPILHHHSSQIPRTLS